MFSKTKQNPSEVSVTTETPNKSAMPSSGVPSIISADLCITGNLQSAGDIQVDGTVVGDIDSKSLTIGEGAEVKGAISADTVRICGSVHGSVRSASVNLAKTARINGDIMHDSLAVEAGAYIEGNIKRLGAAASAPASKPATPPVTGSAVGGSPTGTPPGGASSSGPMGGGTSSEPKKSFGS